MLNDTEQLIISLDPSSTIVGFAVMRADIQLIKAGVIEPDHRGDCSYNRIRSMRRDLRGLLDTIRPGTILVEWTTGKVGGRRHHGLGAGLAVYGCGVGAIATEAEHWIEMNDSDSEVIAILENDWSRGVPKEERQLAIAQMFREYSIGKDLGGDIADAIGLAVWWMKENRVYAN